MEMKKQDHGPECEALRRAMEVRAAMIFYFVKTAKDMGVDYLTLGRRAMFANGVYKVRTSFTDSDALEDFVRQYMPEKTLEAFDGKITECSKARMREESTYCPLAACWQKLTDDEPFIEELCDIAMCGDRGILSCYPQYRFELQGTLFDEGKTCRVQVSAEGSEDKAIKESMTDETVS